ncbi:hypothetical protein [uncultured Cellulomonas sp.]|uniref:hypothetical protein n=1 Tax=uncultured Cellulomonas sp. TaxID=189682 RepID=UPI002613A524|nr:hypothetical protein [uncultured Cellulomonas sp.]
MAFDMPAMFATALALLPVATGFAVARWRAPCSSLSSRRTPLRRHGRVRFALVAVTVVAFTVARPGCGGGVETRRGDEHVLTAPSSRCSRLGGTAARPLRSTPDAVIA